MPEATIRIRDTSRATIEAAGRTWGMSIVNTVTAMTRLWEQAALEDQVAAIRSVNEPDAPASGDQAETDRAAKETADAA